MQTVPSADVKKIALGSDHGGFDMKAQVKEYLTSKGYVVEDVGTHKKMPVDYPVFAYKAARMVANGSCQRAIVFDGAGIGSCMAANKVPGVRAAMVYDVKTAINSREHNNANVISLGAPLLGFPLIKEILDVWLSTDCKEDRHKRRADQILQIERDFTDPQKIKETLADNFSGEDVSQFSDTDLEQIARQITQILQSQGINTAGAMCNCSCCGGSCGGHCAEKASDAVREIINMGASRISYRAGGQQNVPQDLAGFIDHTLLKPEATADSVRKLCDDALEYNFASVCVNPSYVSLAASKLRGSEVKVCTVVGFPLGTHTPQVKALETRQAIREGAKEIDMVINIGALKSGDINLLYRDIRSVVEACNDGSALSKVIIETALLDDEEIVIACETAKRARANYVKTSTGFSSGGATTHDVALMSQVVRTSGMGVKASGGIRSQEDALEMIKAGATRIGASASVQIVQGDGNITESY